MTSDSTHSPARFYGFARTRTFAENFTTLKTPGREDSSTAAVADIPRAEPPKSPEPSADPAPNALALVSKPEAGVAQGQIISAPASDATSIAVLSEAEPSRRAKSRSRRNSRSKRETSRTRRTKAKGMREPKKRLSRLELHQAHCGICGDKLQEEIDERFVNWECVTKIAEDYQLDRSSLYRHAHATGLMAERDRNIRRALGHIIHKADRVHVTADSVVRAVKIFAHINARGEWVNPPTHVVFTSTAARPPKPASVDVELSGTPSHLIAGLKP